MFKLKHHIKKIIAASAATVAAGTLIIAPAKADGTSDVYLQVIAKYTYDTATAAYYIEQYTYGALAILNNWILPDKTDTTANLQSSFTGVTNAALQNATTQQNLQTQLAQDYLGSADLPFLNDMTYQTLLGQLYLKPDPRIQAGQTVNPAYNYIKNAAGLNIYHRPPSSNWKGNPKDIENYQNFYATILSIQSYSAFLLSQQYADYANGGQLSKQQTTLMQQASNSDWFTQVASESIGVVLRQILMYNSQSYVLLTQLLQTQKQALAAQAMTNTLIVLGNQFNEVQLLNKATSSPGNR